MSPTRNGLPAGRSRLGHALGAARPARGCWRAARSSSSLLAVRRSRTARSPFAERVVDDRFHRVDAGLELGLAIEQDVALLDRLEPLDRSGEDVVLAQLVGDARSAASLESNQHGELRPIRGACPPTGGRSGSRPAPTRARGSSRGGPAPGTSARPRGPEMRWAPASTRAAPSAGASKDSTGIGPVDANRVVALARRHVDAGPLDPDGDRAELAVEGVVLRHVRQHVVVPHVLVDAPEPAGEVVGVADQDAARLVGELAETAVRIAAEVVLVALQRRRSSARPSTSVVGFRRSVRCGRGVDAVARLLARALRPQAGGVHRVDADVGAIGRVDHRPESRRDVGGDGDPFREEDHRLAAAAARACR